MQEITIDQARERARVWQKQGLHWHFHVLFPDCIWNTQPGQYAFILEDRTSGQTYVIYSVDGFAKFSQELLKLHYGDSILDVSPQAGSQADHTSALLEQCKLFQQNHIEWHHHMLFPDCIFNQNPGKWSIVMESHGEPRIMTVLYDDEPLEDLHLLEMEYFKQIDPTFRTET